MTILVRLSVRLYHKALGQLSDATIRCNYPIGSLLLPREHKMDINHDHFSDQATALKEIEDAGYTPVTLDFPAESSDDHWHDFDPITFLLSGQVTVTVVETGETCVCGEGTRIVGTRGVLHREQTDGYRALIGLPVEPAALSQPINKPPPVVESSDAADAE